MCSCVCVRNVIVTYFSLIPFSRRNRLKAEETKRQERLSKSEVKNACWTNSKENKLTTNYLYGLNIFIRIWKDVLFYLVTFMFGWKFIVCYKFFYWLENVKVRIQISLACEPHFSLENDSDQNAILLAPREILKYILFKQC